VPLFAEVAVAIVVSPAVAALTEKAVSAAETDVIIESARAVAKNILLFMIPK